MTNFEVKSSILNFVCSSFASQLCNVVMRPLIENTETNEGSVFLIQSNGHIHLSYWNTTSLRGRDTNMWGGWRMEGISFSLWSVHTTGQARLMANPRGIRRQGFIYFEIRITTCDHCNFLSYFPNCVQCEEYFESPTSQPRLLRALK